MEDLRGLLAEEAGTGTQVELPAVVGAGQRVAQDLCLVERVALVRARVREGMRLSVDHEHGDLRPARLDHRAALGVEARKRDPHGLHAA